MEIQTTKKQHGSVRRGRLILAISVSLAVLLLCAVAISSAVTLSSEKMYSGISVDRTNIGKMSKNEALAELKLQYPIDDEKKLTFSGDGVTSSLTLAELSPEISFDSAVEEAYQIGRKGSVFARLRQIHTVRKNGHTIPLTVSINQERLKDALAPIAKQMDEPEQDNQFSITENELIVTRGHSGRRILPEQVALLVGKRILSNDFSPLELTTDTVYPQEITAEYLESEVCGDPIDASYRVENQHLEIIPEKIGVTMNQKEAETIIRESTGDTIRIPVVTTQPSLSASQLRASLFCDRLGTYSSRYNAGDTNRSYNIALACKNINEVVLAPGDVFSYNDTVGPRTAARGFRTAHVYVGNKVEDGIGGGICQVSSTLYNTAVLSDLKIVSRTNHSLPVSYVPMGRDATVSYGSIDFKFENNTSAPIKIVATASGGQTTISVYGSEQHPGRSISIETERTATYPAKLIQNETPDLPEGEVKVEQKGSDGSSYNSYKIIRENGTVISRELLAKSTYVASDRIEWVGTKPKEISKPTETTGENTSEHTAPETSAAPATASPKLASRNLRNEEQL